MWHVSTLLPLDKKPNSQQIPRKRHIGNDINLVVFLDGKTVAFDPRTIRSQFIHNVIAIRRLENASNLLADSQQTRYHISICSKEDVPLFGPTLPKPAIYEKGDSFRDFLFAKLINAELASYRTVYFSKRLRLGRKALLDDLVTKFFPVEDTPL